MKLRNLLGLLCLLFYVIPVATAQSNAECIEDATISIRGQDGDLLLNCQGDGIPDLVRFTTSDLSTPFGHLLTDNSGNILFVQVSNTFDFENFPAASYRVYAFSFIGQVLAQPGDNIFTDELASICYALTTNFIQVENTVPDGGTVATDEGTTTVYVCPGDGMADIVSMTTTSDAPQYAYIITDDNNLILNTSIDSNIDFDGAPEGICHVWGVAYVGNLTATPGDDITAAQLADGCFDLSNNFVSVIRSVPDGGTVSLSNGETSFLGCEGAAGATILTFVNQTTSVAPYTFILTNENNEILLVLDGNTLDLDDAPLGASRLWGLSYTGNLLAQPGIDAAAADLSDDCFDLSDNFVEIVKRELDAGAVSLQSGDTAIRFCVGDGLADEITVVNTGDGADEYIYVITTEAGEILNFSESGVIDFDGAGAGLCLVWGLAYSGNLTAEIGDNALDVELSDECFQLSDNFISVTRLMPVGGTVSLSSGDTETLVCVGDGQADVLTVVSSGNAGGTFTFVVTAIDGEILAFSEDGVIDFDDAGAGICLVWGLAYTGNLTAAVGDNATQVDLSDGCFDLSDNFVTVNRDFVDGGTVALDSGDTVITICANDGEPDLLTATNVTQSSEAYIYVITTEAGEILNFSESGEIDFEGAGGGVCLIWGLSYTGNLTAEIGDNAGLVDLSDGCFELSENVVTVIREAPESGVVTLASGETQTRICVGDGLSDLLTFVATGNTGGNLIFVVTDSNGEILGLSESGEIDFEDAGAGVCLVWGLSYTGTLTAEIGDNLLDGNLSDGCYSFTDNPVSISRIFVDGGTVGTEEGIENAVICSDDEPNILTFIFNSASSEPYTFLVTDFDDNLLFFLSGNVIDFNQAAPGIYRVWGLSYTGNLTAEISDNIADTPLSDECFDLSENFITLRVELVDGGLVGMPDGNTSIFTCPGDDNPDVVMFDSTGISTGAYIYVITDSENNILDFPPTDQFDFDSAPEGTCLVWGLAYTGQITASVGENITTTTLSDECYDLSDNFITVVRQVPVGGTIATVEGDTVVYTCTSIGSGDNFTVEVTTDFTGPTLIVLTDDTNEILSTGTGLDFNFDGFANDVYRLYNVAHTGNFTGNIGDNLFSVFLSDDCYDISDNFIIVNVDDADGGTVATTAGDTLVYTCPGDGNPDVVSFQRIDASNSKYTYVITDENNLTLFIIDGDELDFENLPPGNGRVWGLAYTGNLIFGSQSNIFESSLSDDCYDLSDNFITIVRQVPEAGSITSPNGQELTLCVGDGSPDEVVFEVTGASDNDYAYLITDSDGFLLTALLDNSFDFENASGGNCRIYGIAYTGELIAIPGDNVADVALSTDCYDLTDDFIQLHRIGVDGSIVFSASAADGTAYVCAGDGIADNIIFLNGSLATDGEYNYAITTENNVILSVLPGNEQDFENTGFSRLRVFGISYTGNLSVTFGDTITTSVLSDSCYSLSDNFLTIVMDLPDGGSVTTADGDTATLVCPGATDGFLSVTNTSSSISGYFYLLTDTTNVILSVETDPDIDFNNLDPGFYRIWGVSYTGLITATVGEIATESMLATSCYELSENFIAVERGITVDPGMISELSGQDTIYTCPGNDMADLIVVLTTSADTNYSYVITDTMNNILIPDIIGNVIDFDNATPGIFRIYGIAYNDSLTAAFGQNVLTDPLSDGCSGASENFITIVHLNPIGGTISTTDGETAISVVAGDGIPDAISFDASSASPTPYVFVVTNDSDEILAILDGNTQDFEGAGVGVCRVWGLAYTGTLTAAVGDTITSAILSNSCFDLTENFVEVTRLAPFAGGGTVETRSEEVGDNDDALRPTIRVKVAPNPAAHYLDAIYELKNPQSEQTTIQLVSSTGQVILTEKSGAVDGFNDYRIELGNLPSGIYLLYVRNGSTLQWTKFIKR